MNTQTQTQPAAPGSKVFIAPSVIAAAKRAAYLMESNDEQEEAKAIRTLIKAVTGEE